MSLLSEYQKKEALLNQLRDELQKLESNQELTKELEFKHKLEDLMTSHQKTPDDVIEILDPNGTLTGRQQQEQASGKTRAKRKLKVYVHPETGERVETRGGNQKTLKQWKDKHGAETVESWRTDEDAPQQQTTASADPDDKPVPSSKPKKKETA